MPKVQKRPEGIHEHKAQSDQSLRWPLYFVAKSQRPEDNAVVARFEDDGPLPPTDHQLRNTDGLVGLHGISYHCEASCPTGSSGMR